MKNLTKQLVRHFNHKHFRFLHHLKSHSNDSSSLNISTNFSQPFESSTNNCFSTNQVLVIIAVTCFLNLAFIILIMICVQILGSTSNEHETQVINGIAIKLVNQIFVHQKINDFESKLLQQVTHFLIKIANNKKKLTICLSQYTLAFYRVKFFSDLNYQKMF